MVGQVETDHQPAAAHFGDRRLAGLDRPHPGQQLITSGGGVGRQPAFDQVERGERSRAGDRVATERRAVFAGGPLHDLVAGDQGGQREAARQTLAGGDDVGHDAVVLAGPHRAGSPDARLDLVHHEQDAVLVAQVAQRLQPAGGRNDVATLALDRLDEDGGDVAGLGHATEQHVLDVVGPGPFTVEGERGVVAAGRDDPEPAPVLGLRRGEREAAQRATVERSVKGDHVGAAGEVASELEGALDRLGAGVGEEHPRRAHAGRHALRQPLAQLGVDRMVEVARAVVQAGVDLGVDRGSDDRVRMSGGVDGDPGVEVEEPVAVDVLEHDAVAALDHEWIDAGE